MRMVAAGRTVNAAAWLLLETLGDARDDNSEERQQLQPPRRRGQCTIAAGGGSGADPGTLRKRVSREVTRTVF